MGECYEQLSLSERIYIQSQLELGFKAAAIASALKRGPSTISCELRRNGWRRSARGHPALAGVVEVDEAYWGGEETGATGWQTELKTRIIVTAEEDGNGIGRIRLRTVPDVSKASLHGFIRQAVAPGSTIRTDGWPAYRGLDGYVHDRQVQSHQPEEEHLLPRIV